MLRLFWGENVAYVWYDDSFHAVPRWGNWILCILELGSCWCFHPQTGNHTWCLNLLQTTNRLSWKKWETLSHWFHPICLAEILSSFRCDAIFHFIYFLFSIYNKVVIARDEASLFWVQPVAAVVEQGESRPGTLTCVAFSFKKKPKKQKELFLNPQAASHSYLHTGVFVCFDWS